LRKRVDRGDIFGIDNVRNGVRLQIIKANINGVERVGIGMAIRASKVFINLRGGRRFIESGIVRGDECTASGEIVSSAGGVRWCDRNSKSLSENDRPFQIWIGRKGARCREVLLS
jgi:hypothetical protein